MTLTTGTERTYTLKAGGFRNDAIKELKRLRDSSEIDVAEIFAAMPQARADAMIKPYLKYCINANYRAGRLLTSLRRYLNKKDMVEL